MSEKDKLQNEMDFLSLLLRHKDLVDEWISEGPEIKFFDEIHHPILDAVRVAFNQNVLLTRRQFVDILKAGPYKKVDIISQEYLYNRINHNISNAKRDDFYHLRSKIVESHISKYIVSYIDDYSRELKDKGGLFASKKLSSRLSRLMVDSEDTKQAVYEDVREYYPDYIKEIEEKASKEDEDIITCGIKEIDYAMVVGFAPGTLTLFCADVGAYKSTMMLNIAVNIWKSGDKNVLVVPLEMPRSLWLQKMMSRETKIPFDKIQHPKMLNEEDWNKLKNESQKWDNLKKFYIMEAPERIPISYLRREIEKHIDSFKPDVVIVDYIANLVSERSWESLRSDEQIGNMLKDLRQLGRPGGMGLHKGGFSVISGAQINREGLKRYRKSGAVKGSFFSEDIHGSHQYSADADNIFGQMKDMSNSDRLHIFVIKTRYGRGIFPNGSSKTALEVQGNIGLIKGENTDWIDEIAQETILSKVDDPLEDFDASELGLVTDGDLPWGDIEKI